MLSINILFIISLVSMVIGQIVFILALLNKANTERVELIQLHQEHLSAIKEQRDLYRELLDDFIKNNKVDDNENKTE